MNTELLVERCKQGDNEAMGMLYNTYGPKLTATCRRIVHEKQAAEDIVHDAFIIIFTSLHSLKDNRRVAGWMNKIVTNLAYEYVKTRKSHAASLDDIQDSMPVEPEEEALGTLSLDQLNDMVNRLPNGYRRVFRLYVLEGLSHKEISRLLDIEPHTSSSMLFFARKRLRKMLADSKKVIILLLVTAIPFGLLLRKKESRQPAVVRRSVGKKQNGLPAMPETREKALATRLPIRQKPAPAAIASPAPGSTVAAETAVTATVDTAKTEADSVKSHRPMPAPSTFEYTNKDYSLPVLPRHGLQNGWQLGIAVNLNGNPGAGSTGLPSYYELAKGDMSSELQPPLESFKDWEHYALYLSQSYIDNNNQPGQSLLAIASHNSGSIRQHREFDLPLSVEVMASHALGSRWSFGTGVGYLKLGSTTTTGEGAYHTRERQTVRNIVIPAKVDYALHRGNRLMVFLSGGIRMEVPVYVRTDVTYVVNGKVAYKESPKRAASVRWSVHAGLGLQYNLSPSVGLFIEPSLYYRFPKDSKVQTVFDNHRLNFTLPVGIIISY